MNNVSKSFLHSTNDRKKLPFIASLRTDEETKREKGAAKNPWDDFKGSRQIKTPMEATNWQHISSRSSVLV